MALTADQLKALAENKLLPDIEDVAFTGSPMTSQLLESQSIDFDGGNKLEFVINFDYNNVQWWSGSDTLETNTKTKRENATLQWRDATTPVKLEKTDIEKNNSPEGIRDLMEAERDAARNGMREALSNAIYLGTGDKPNNQDTAPRFEGWEAILGTGTYAGIDPSSDITTASDWQAYIATENTLTLRNMEDAFRSLNSEDDANVSHIFCNPSTYSKIWDLAQSSEQFHNIDDTAALGFEGVTFNGARIFADNYAPGTGGGSTDNDLFFLSLEGQDHTNLWLHSEVMMSFDPFEKPVNQQVLISYLRLKGNMATTQRKVHGKIKNINPDN